MERTFWGFFHDGTVSRLRGTVPGQVVLFVEIQYLRAMFPTQGSGFEVTLAQCTHIEYQEWDHEPITSFETILSREPELVNVQSLQPLVLNCVMGTLELAYGEAAVCTDAGQRLSYAELEAGSKKYWDAWREKRHGSGDA